MSTIFTNYSITPILEMNKLTIDMNQCCKFKRRRFDDDRPDFNFGDMYLKNPEVIVISLENALNITDTIIEEAINLDFKHATPSL